MADKLTKSDVIRMAKENNVHFVRLWFTDILGMLKGFAIPVSQLEMALEEGLGFDGSSIEGFTRIEESDMIALPDPSTFRILPWESNGESVAVMFCDILNPDGTPYEGDPRYVLRRMVNKAQSMGYTLMVGPELEYFYFPSPQDVTPLDQAGYFDLVPLDYGTELRKETVRKLEALGIEVEYSHHEVAPSQHEIDFAYADALTTADHVMTYKFVVKKVAQDHGVYATFMPKPVYGINGSGMHTHQSLFRDGRNAFFAADRPYYLSETACSYIAGILRHIREITLVLNQWVNSYKRLVPGYEAPVYVCWAQRNRSALIRVPMYKPGREKATRIELRSPDSACNPYLAFAVMLAAGLKGIEKRYPLPDPVGDNIYEMTEEERRKAGIETLPEDLHDAILEAERSELLRETLGEYIFEQLLRNKRILWEEYRAQVTEYEIKKFLPIL
ncbi:MAG: glutamine synthetase family protein [candidate division KSB1 bacterium]|nr:glutamine synthetase family protein [candidate division KSB1 bacterium]